MVNGLFGWWELEGRDDGLWREKHGDEWYAVAAVDGMVLSHKGRGGEGDDPPRAFILWDLITFFIVSVSNPDTWILVHRDWVRPDFVDYFAYVTKMPL